MKVFDREASVFLSLAFYPWRMLPKKQKVYEGEIMVAVTVGFRLSVALHVLVFNRIWVNEVVIGTRSR